jgi:hypothetical protein
VSRAHSPRPWRKCVDSTGEVTVFDAHNNDVCKMAGNVNDGSNARLIEAAPAMLELLQKLRRGDLHQRVRPLYDAAQAVIAQATGSKL